MNYDYEPRFSRTGTIMRVDSGQEGTFMKKLDTLTIPRNSKKRNTANPSLDEINHALGPNQNFGINDSMFMSQDSKERSCSEAIVSTVIDEKPEEKTAKKPKNIKQKVKNLFNRRKGIDIYLSDKDECNVTNFGT